MISDFDHAPGATEALRDWRGKQIFPTEFGSEDMRAFSRELRRRSIFSARTTNAEYLEEIARVVDDILSGKINLATGRWRLLRKLKQLGYDPAVGFPQDMADVPPAERGSLQDLSSESRLDLILETNTRMAANYARMVAGNTPYALHAYPAWELVRLFQREVPRGSPESKSVGWMQRWCDAAESVAWEGVAQIVKEQTRFIARKDSPLWPALGNGDGSDYTDTLGNPYPPFAFRSGMAWRAVARAECVALGLVTGDETPARMEGQLSPGEKEVRAVAEKLSPDLRAELDRELNSDAEVASLARSMAEHRARQGEIRRDRLARSAQVQAEHQARMKAMTEGVA